MEKERVARVLMAHAEELVGHPEAMQRINLTDEERIQLAPLFQIAEQLCRSMKPVRPSPAFVRSLRNELVESAQRQMTLKSEARRTMMIAAAALGSLVSVASVVGAIVFVVLRLRARSQAQALQAPTA